MPPRLPFIRLLAGLLVAGAGELPSRVAGADAPAPSTRGNRALYTLTITDRIHLEVVGEGDLTAPSQRIDGHGNVNLVYVGEVHLAGLTIAAAQEAVQNAYIEGRYLRHPQVTISVEEYAARTVSIQGAVKNPGRFELPPEASLTVVELVTKAGGFTDIGKGSAVRVQHVGGTGSDSTQKSIETFDIQGIITGKSSMKSDDPALLLRPGDIVYVPEKII